MLLLGINSIKETQFIFREPSMEKQKIDLYLTTNAKYFEPTAIPVIKQKLEKLNKKIWLLFQ